MDFFNFGDEEIKRELEKKIEKQKDKVLNLFESRGNEGIKYKNKSYKPNLKIDPSRDSNFEYFKDKTTNILRNENPYYLEEFLDKIYKGVNIYSLIDLYFDLSGNSNESILFLKKMEYGKGGEENKDLILDDEGLLLEAEEEENNDSILDESESEEEENNHWKNSSRTNKELYYDILEAKDFDLNKKEIPKKELNKDINSYIFKDHHLKEVKETYLKLPTSSLSKIKSLLDGLEEC